MPTPQLLNDIINVLLLLAPAAAVVCLVLGGISLRREGGGITFVLGGGFSKWMFWCVVFLTLQALLAWFSSFGVAVPVTGGGISTSWLAALESALPYLPEGATLIRKLNPAMRDKLRAAIPGLKERAKTLVELLNGAKFLFAERPLALDANLLSSWNSGTQFATVDVLNSAWNYLAGTIMPIAAGLAIMGAVFNFVRQRPAMRLVAVSLALLSVSGIWYLVVDMAS